MFQGFRLWLPKESIDSQNLIICNAKEKSTIISKESKQCILCPMIMFQLLCCKKVKGLPLKSHVPIVILRLIPRNIRVVFIQFPAQSS